MKYKEPKQREGYKSVELLDKKPSPAGDKDQKPSPVADKASGEKDQKPSADKEEISLYGDRDSGDKNEA